MLQSECNVFMRTTCKPITDFNQKTTISTTNDDREQAEIM